MNENPHQTPGKRLDSAVWIPWIVLLLLFWVMLVEGRLDSLWFAVPVLAGAFVLRHALPTSPSLRRIHVGHAILFVPSFIGQSIVGGIDVAWRALAPAIPIQPRLVTFPLRLRTDGARVFLAQVISLMPGTLACDIDGHAMLIHALNGSEDSIIADAARLEQRVAALFREQLEAEA